MDRFFRFPRTQEEQPTVLPKVNLIKKDDAFHLEAETPGMTKKDVLIEFHNGILTLNGDREQSSESDKTIIVSVNSENKVLSGALDSTTRLIRKKSLPRWIRES
jgi:HSP20 family molecular chaperone IbpA